MTRGTVQRRGALATGAPRRHWTTCLRDCGWRGVRTADTRQAVRLGPPCPRCGGPVYAAGGHS